MRRRPTAGVSGITTWTLLRDRTVAVVVAVELLSSLAMGATVTALGWQACSRAHDPLVLGLLGPAEFTPAALDAGLGDQAVWPLYVLAFAWGVGNAFAGPTLNPLLAAGVPSGHEPSVSDPPGARL